MAQQTDLGGSAPVSAAGAYDRPAFRWLAVTLVLLGAAVNLVYLWNHCPLSLSEDESHYWEWARHLDYGYYSKGPGIAWIMAAIMQVGRWFGLDPHTMPLLRTPAVLFSICTGLLSIGLARRIFRDDRVALTVTILSASVPMFVLGALLLTIDSPMFLCWAAATYCLWRFLEPSHARPLDAPVSASASSVIWLYLAGFLTGIGMLCKPVLIALPFCAGVAALISPWMRCRLATWHTALALLLALILQTPLVIWNAQHGWVTFLHIRAQGGFQATPKITHWYSPFARFGEYVGAQVGVLGGLLFFMLAIAIGWAWSQARGGRFRGGTSVHTGQTTPQQGPQTSQNGCNTSETSAQIGWKFLLALTLPLWFFYAVLSWWTHTEPNWPAASYFTAMVLLAGVIVQHWNRPTRAGRAWRLWTLVAVLWGLSAATFVQHTEWFYPLAKSKLATIQDPAARRASRWNPVKWDPSLRKLRGQAARGQAIQAVRVAMREQTGRDPLIATARYDTSSSLAFYLPDHPFVYSVMSLVGGRRSQYDIWPGLNERRDGHLVHEGQDVLLIGPLDVKPVNVLEEVIRPAFTRVDPLELVPVYYDGALVWEVAVWRCYGFRGFADATSQGGY